jgi:hypothetical protein
MVLDFPNTATAYLVAFQGRREGSGGSMCLFLTPAGGGDPFIKPLITKE